MEASPDRHIDPLVYVLHLGESALMTREESLGMLEISFGMDTLRSEWTTPQVELHRSVELQRITSSGHGFICVVDNAREGARGAAERAAATLAGAAKPGLIIVEGRFLILVCSCLQRYGVQMEYEGFGNLESSSGGLGVHVTEAKTFINVVDCVN